MMTGDENYKTYEFTVVSSGIMCMQNFIKIVLSTVESLCAYGQLRYRGHDVINHAEYHGKWRTAKDHSPTSPV